MVRYQDDSNSNRTLLIGAGVTAGVLAGALLAHRYGGWTGMRRRLSRSSGPLLAALRAAIPSRTLAAILEVIDIDDILAGLLAGTRRPRRTRRVRARHRPDRDLDEYEVEDSERAAAGLDDDEIVADADDVFDDFDEDDDDDPDSPIARLRRFRHASADDLEDEYFDEEDEGDEDDDLEDEDEEADEDEEEVLTPAAIEEALLAAFKRHPVLRGRALEITVHADGVAELTGWVRRERDIRTARRVAAKVPGVERVIVDVAVRDGVRVAADTLVPGA